MWKVSCDTCGYRNTISQFVQECPNCGSRLPTRGIRAAVPQAPRQVPEPVPAPALRSRPKPVPPRNLTPVRDAPVLEGVVKEVYPAGEVVPEIDWGRMALGLLVLIDLILLGASLFITVLIGVILLAILMQIFRLGGCLWSLLGLLFQPVLELISALGRVFFGQGAQTEHVPLTIYRVQPRRAGGRVEFEVRGHLQHTVIDREDRVRIWGPVRNETVLFRRGERVDPRTGRVSRLTRRGSTGWFWFSLLVAVNVVAFLWWRVQTS